MRGPEVLENRVTDGRSRRLAPETSRRFPAPLEEHALVDEPGGELLKQGVVAHVAELVIRGLPDDCDPSARD
jgi:hypothetical protein